MYSFIRMHIIIATDSRGYQLLKYIHDFEPFSAEWSVHHIIIPGGKIVRLQEAIISKINALNLVDCDKFIVIAGGICNLTEKIQHEKGGEIWYDTSSDHCQTLISQFHSIHSHFTQQSNVIIKFV